MINQGTIEQDARENHTHTREAHMFMAIAAETFKHPLRKSDYKVWYLEIDNAGSVVGIGVKTREEVLKSLFDFFRRIVEGIFFKEVYHAFILSTGH